MDMNLNHYHYYLLEHDEKYKQLALLRDMIDAAMDQMIVMEVNRQVKEQIEEVKKMRELI